MKKKEEKKKTKQSLASFYDPYSLPGERGLRLSPAPASHRRHPGPGRGRILAREVREPPLGLFMDGQRQFVATRDGLHAYSENRRSSGTAVAASRLPVPRGQNAAFTADIEDILVPRCECVTPERIFGVSG